MDTRHWGVGDGHVPGGRRDQGKVNRKIKETYILLFVRDFKQQKRHE